MSAAPSAGTRNPNVKTVDESWIIGDARITTSAPINDATTKLPAASTIGRVAEQDRALLVLGGGADGQAPAREPRERPDRRGDQR